MEIENRLWVQLNACVNALKEIEALDTWPWPGERFQQAVEIARIALSRLEEAEQ